MHGGQWYQAIYEGGFRREGWVDLSSSISPYGPGPRARRLWPGLIDQLDRYPDPEYHGLTAAIGTHFGLDPDSVVVTAGATEGIDLIYRALKPRQVAVVIPAFAEYAERARALGIAVSTVTSPQRLGAGPGILVLANPINPTGQVWPRAEMRKWREVAHRQGWRWVVDEAFLEFLPDWRERSMMATAATADDLIVLQSLTKFYGLAALRLGFVVAAASLRPSLRRLQVPWQVSWAAAQMGAAALADQPYFAETRRRLIADRATLASQLESRARIIYPAAANFLLVQPQGISVPRLVEGLKGEGVLVRDARSFAGLSQPTVRIAVKRARDHERLLSAWDAVVTRCR
ncbi:MAG: aminotransferase class I/II-fold pyridoxal phosphate-dependent enzyme [Thermaerobacter sp.]|nr:aminotransferase class I/II-fold pyridoxal phosphate-dependent enzyme [Thermaerobacter sp.]